MRPATVTMLLLCLPAAAGEPRVRKGHPRIYVTAADLPKLRARCAGPMRQRMAEMRRAEWIMKRRPAAGWADATNVGYPAFLHLVTGEKRYLEKTVEFLDAFAADPPRDQYLTPEWIRAASGAADFCWNGLSPEQGKRYGLALLDAAEWVLARLWRHSDFSNHFVNEHLSVLYVAVLLDGEGIASARAARLLKTGREYLLEHAVPAANEVAGVGVVAAGDSPAAAWAAAPDDGLQPDACFVGGQPEGFSYNDWGYARPLALTCEMWRTATGQDLFAGSSFFRGQGIWHAYGLRPDNGAFARSEDCPSGLKPAEDLKSFLHLLAARMRDPLAAHLAGKIKWRHPQKAWKEVLFSDPSVEAKSPRRMSLPAAACFPQLGHVYFRTAFGSPDAAFALFQCGPIYAGHQHLDNNSFVVHRSGSLAIDAGTNDYTSHRANYYARTIAHNAVLVFDPRERFPSGVWGGGRAAAGNDGGQLRAGAPSRVGQLKPGAPGGARLIAFAAGRHAAGCAGDATAAYAGAKLQRAVRAFFHLRPEGPGPDAVDTFVVHDDVRTRRGLPATWVIHSIERPKLAGRRFLISHDGGQLTGEVLRPRRAELKVVGGPGRECWVDGRDHPPLKTQPDPEAGAWRIELPFDDEALVLLHAGRRTGRLADGARVTIGRGRLVAKVANGPLLYEVALDRRVSPFPVVRVLRDGRVVETLSVASGP